MLFAYSNPFPRTPPRPYLAIYLRNQFYTTNTITALVDSGADYSIFPLEIANDLKLDLTKARLWTFAGTTGKLQKAWLADAVLTIVGEDEKTAFEVGTTCAFCDTFEFAGGALLGQNGFFSKFKTIFHQPQGQFELEQWSPDARDK